jgi:hypothetical protein
VDDLDFAEVMVRATASSGTPFFKRARVGMPRIPSPVLKNVIYLYPTEESAEKGIALGGSGFLVGVPSIAEPEMVFVYAVTNYHNINGKAPGAPVVRINKIDGTTEIFPFSHDDWHFDAEAGHDVAAVQIPLKSGLHDYKMMHVGGLVTRESIEKHRIGPGDGTFMVGRFVDHDGVTTNQPAARFGFISINPTKMMSPWFHKPVDMFCLDTNSRTGYSGSPVYIYRTYTDDLEELQKEGNKGKIPIITPPLFMLLGIHCGQFPEFYDVENYTDAELKALEQESLQYISKAQIKGLSGMTRVAPAWAIVDLLNSAHFKNPRNGADALLKSWGRKRAEEEVEKARADGRIKLPGTK